MPRRDTRFDGDLPIEQQPDGPEQVPEVSEADLKTAYEDAFAQAAENDPEIQSFIVEETPLPEGEEEPAGRGFWRGLADNLDSVFDLGGPAGITLSPDVGKAVARGATRAVDESLEFLAEDVGGTLLAKTRTGRALAGLVFTDEEEDFFFDWYENRASNETALFGNEFRENHLKYENDTFAVHMIEGLTQFAVGFVGLGKVRGLAGLSARVAQRIGRGRNLGVVGRAAARAVGVGVEGGAKGAIVDFGMFDPHEQRLADLVESNPRLSNFVTRRLASDVNDTNIEGRIKNMFEGIIIGSVIDGFTESVRALRTVRRAKAGELTPEDAIAAITEHQRRIKAALETPPPADDIVRAVENPDGTARIVSNTDTGVREVSGGRGLSIETPEGTIKASPVEGTQNFRVTAARSEVSGQGIGSGLYEQLARDVQGRGGNLLSDTAGNRSTDAENFWRGLVKKGKATFDEVANEFTYKLPDSPGDVPAKSMGDAQAQAEGVNWSARRAREPIGAEGVAQHAAEWQAAAKKLEDATDLESMLRVYEGTDIPLRYVSEPREVLAAVEAISDMIGPQARDVLTHGDVRQLADNLFHGIEPDQVLEWAAKTFGDTADLPIKMFGFRAYLVRHVATTRQLAKILDNTPHSPVSAMQLGRSMDTMFNLYADVAGTSSNVGRALESQKIDPGSLRHVPPELKQAASVRDEFLAAKRAYTESLQSGDADVVRGALQNLDEVGEKMGGLVGGRPKNKSGLAGIADKDARRRVKSEAKAEQTEIDGMPPKPDIQDQLPAAMKWYDDASTRINEQVQAARREAITEIPFESPAQKPKSFRNMSKDEIRQTARMIFMQDDTDVNAIMGLIMAPKRKVRPGAVGMKEALIAYRINAMLSNPATHAVNSLNNIAFMHLKGLDFWWSGVSPRARAQLRGSGTTAKEMRTAGWDLVTGYWMGLGDAWRNAKQSFKVQDNVLRPGTARDGLKQIGQVAPESKLWGGLWTLMNTPGRLLITADEFAQQMAYRSHVRMQVLRTARREGIPVEDLGQYVTDHMKHAFTDDGAGTIANSMRFSEEVTFKTPLDQGAFAKAMQRAAQNNALVRFMFPFIRTPANLIKRGYQRTPLAAMWSKEISEEMAAGGERAAIATAQIEIGSAILATSATLAFTGYMTGRGPLDPELNRQWRGMGNQPYSLRVPGTGVSVSYRRMDPIMMFPAAVADLVSAAGEIDEDEKAEALGVLLVGLTTSIGSKAYFQGATSVMEALTSGDPNKWEQALSEAALSFSPGLLRGINPDPMVRETNDFIDRVMSGIVGFSDNLEPRRNILGQKQLRSPGIPGQQFNPFTITFMSERDREFNERLFEMGKAYAMPSEKMRVGSEAIDLTARGRWNGPNTPKAQRDQSPYDRWMELMGTVRLGSKTLEESLRELVASSEFANAEKHGTVHEGGQAYLLVARELGKYQRVAYAQMIGEYPAIINERARLLILGGGEKAGLSDVIEQASQ